MKFKRITIMLVTMIAASSSANAAGFSFNFDLGDAINSKLKPQTEYEMVVPRDAVELKYKDVISLYEDVAAVAYKKHWNVIIVSPSTSRGKKISSVIQNKQRNIALKKGKGNKYNTKQYLSKVSRLKIEKGKEYKILLRSKGIGSGDNI